MDCTTPPRTLVLPDDARSARRVRAFFDDAYCDRHNARLHEEAALLASELVANAVRHGSPPVTVHLQCVGTDTLEVRVHDNNPAVPVVGRMEDADAEGGRGMALVNLLTDAWGVDQIPGDGKTVWFRMDAARD